MLKEVLKILIITFLLVLFYDTIDIYFNQLSNVKETELVVVKHELEEGKKLLDTTIPYETPNFCVWPFVTTFSCAFCLILFRYSSPCQSYRNKLFKNFNGSKKVSNKPIRLKHHEEIHLKKNLKKKDDIIVDSDSDLLRSSYNGEKNVVRHEKKKEIFSREEKSLNNSSSNVSTQGKTGVKAEHTKACLPFSTTNLFSTDLLSPKIKIFPNDCITPSANSLLHLDCNSKNFHDILIDNRNIGKIGLPAIKNFNKDVNLEDKHIPKKKYNEKKSDYFTEVTVRRDDSTLSTMEEISLVSNQDKLADLFSSMYGNIKKEPVKVEKNTSTHFITFSESDMKNLEKKLEALENELKRSQQRTNEFVLRMNAAEVELVDLHEQMYSMFSKFEEEKKTNYVIVSQVSNESNLNEILEKKTLFISNDEVRYSGQAQNPVFKIEPKDTEIKKRTPTEKQEISPYSGIQPIKEESLETVTEKSKSKLETNDNSRITVDSQSYDDDEIKTKSVALEALLENNPVAFIRNFTPKKIQRTVPPHILPPYRRSTYTGTDSKADLVKKRKKFKN